MGKLGEREVNDAAYRAEKTGPALEFQDFVQEAMHYELGISVCLHSSRAYQYAKGESLAGVEIKHDERVAETGNIFIETAEKGRTRPGDFVPSGIYANDRDWIYAIGGRARFYLFAVSFLRQIHKARHYREVGSKIGTSRGFLVPVREAEKYAWVIFENGKRLPTGHRLGDVKT